MEDLSKRNEDPVIGVEAKQRSRLIGAAGLASEIRKENNNFHIAPLNPALKGRACMEHRFNSLFAVDVFPMIINGSEKLKHRLSVSLALWVE